MNDGIIKGVGNSRFLKSVPSFLSLYPTYEAFAEALVAGTLPIDLNGINEAGWSQLGTPLNKANLLSDETAENLGLNVHLVDKPLSDYPESSIVWLAEDGAMTPFFVLQHNYQSDLNGTGRTLLMRVRSAGQMVWDESGVNTYAGSTIDTYLNDTYKKKFGADVQSAMQSTSFPYTVGGGDSTLSTLTRDVFLASATEINGRASTSNSNLEGVKFPKSNMYSAFAPFERYYSWTRSPYLSSNTSLAWTAINSGSISAQQSVTEAVNVFPVFTLPSTFALRYYIDGRQRVISDTPFVEASPSSALNLLGCGEPLVTAYGSYNDYIELELEGLDDGLYVLSAEGVPVTRYVNINVLTRGSGIKSQDGMAAMFGAGMASTPNVKTDSSIIVRVELLNGPIALFCLSSYDEYRYISTVSMSGMSGISLAQEKIQVTGTAPHFYFRFSSGATTDSMVFKIRRVF